MKAKIRKAVRDTLDAMNKDIVKENTKSSYKQLVENKISHRDLDTSLIRYWENKKNGNNAGEC
jgi:hypothetical protein